MNGRWLPPFRGISGRERWTGVLLCLGVLVAFGWLMMHRWPESPGNVIDFELAGRTGAGRFLLAWNIGEQRRAAQVILLDAPFLVAYGLGGALLLDGVARWSADWHRGWSRLLARMAWLPLAAAAFDIVEDVALIAVAANRIEPWAEIARAMARTKFALLFVFYGIVVVALGSAAVARVRRRADDPVRALSG